MQDGNLEIKIHAGNTKYYNHTILIKSSDDTMLCQITYFLRCFREK